MKPGNSAAKAEPLPRRDLIAIFAYLNCNRPGAKSVDGCFERVQARLDRLAAAARMQ